MKKLSILESVGLTKNEFTGMAKAGETIITDNQKTLLDFTRFQPIL